MKTYRVTYTLKLPRKERVSPSTGKPYKKPRTFRQWVSLSELLTQDSLGEALGQALRVADVNGWELNRVSEETD